MAEGEAEEGEGVAVAVELTVEGRVVLVPAMEEKLSPWGSVVHWRELYREQKQFRGRNVTEWYVRATCGGCGNTPCGKKRRVRVTSGLNRPGGLTLDSLSLKKSTGGLCKKCFRSNQGALRSGVRWLDIQYIWSERYGRNSEVHWQDETAEGVHVKCAGCGEWRRLKRRYIMLKTAAGAFTGLCESCGCKGVSRKRRETPPRPKFVGVKINAKGTRTTFLEDPSQPAVILYAVCQHTREVDREVAIQRWDKYTDTCSECLRDRSSLVERLTELAILDTAGRIGQKNDISTAKSEALLKAINAVASLWKVVRNNPRPFDKKLLLITQLDLAPELGIHGQDDKTKRTQVAAWLKKGCDLNSMFSDSHSWYRCFVQTVVEEIERGSAPEAVVKSLQLRHSRARPAA
jgi:hypothetical protein